MHVGYWVRILQSETNASNQDTNGYSLVGRASVCRMLQLSDGPWSDSGWPDLCVPDERVDDSKDSTMCWLMVFIDAPHVQTNRVATCWEVHA